MAVDRERRQPTVSRSGARRRRDASSEVNESSSALDPALAELVDHLSRDLARVYVRGLGAAEPLPVDASDSGSEEA